MYISKQTLRPPLLCSAYVGVPIAWHIMNKEDIVQWRLGHQHTFGMFIAMSSVITLTFFYYQRIA